MLYVCETASPEIKSPDIWKLEVQKNRQHRKGYKQTRNPDVQGWERRTSHSKQGAHFAPSVSFSAQAHNSWEAPASLVRTELPCLDSSTNLFQKPLPRHITMLYQPSGQPSGGLNSKHPHIPLRGVMSFVDGCSSGQIIPLS